MKTVMGPCEGSSLAARSMVCSRCGKARLGEGWTGVLVEEGMFGLGVPAPIIISSKGKKSQKKHQYNGIVKILSAACNRRFPKGRAVSFSLSSPVPREKLLVAEWRRISWRLTCRDEPIARRSHGTPHSPERPGASGDCRSDRKGVAARFGDGNTRIALLSHRCVCRLRA